MKTALIPGTFDPFTDGHLRLAEIASRLFDKVVIGIFQNPEKETYFTEKERFVMMSLAVKNLPNVTCEIGRGYTADYAKEIGASCILRGYRTTLDANYEYQMAAFNKARSGVETLLVPSPESLADVSSTAVREKLMRGEDIEKLVPPIVLQYIKEIR